MTGTDRAKLPSEPTAVTNLRRVLGIRLLLLMISMAALLFAARGLDLPIPLAPLTAVIGLAFAATALYREWISRTGHAAGSDALTVQLLLDVALLTGILFPTGGWTNPLVSLFLVPIAVAAALLPRARTWAVAAAAALAYTGLTRYHRPVFDLHHGGDDFALHVSGMWLTFVIAGALLAYFGTRFAETLRRRDRALARAREANLRNEQIMGIATLAAGTAHELATPLATIAVIAAELEATARPALREDLAELSRQVAVCREILQRLRGAAAPSTIRRTCGEFLDEATERFQLLRPAVPLRTALPAADRQRTIDVDLILQQALLNLLDNAADASPDGIELTGRIVPGPALEIAILDRGPGFADANAAPSTGRPTAVRGPGQGLGMGLVLANTTIERRGGQVFAAPRPGGGTCVRAVLPLVEPPGGGG